MTTPCCKGTDVSWCISWVGGKMWTILSKLDWCCIGYASLTTLMYWYLFPCCCTILLCLEKGIYIIFAYLMHLISWAQNVSNTMKAWLVCCLGYDSLAALMYWLLLPCGCAILFHFEWACTESLPTWGTTSCCKWYLKTWNQCLTRAVARCATDWCSTLMQRRQQFLTMLPWSPLFELGSRWM